MDFKIIIYFIKFNLIYLYNSIFSFFYKINFFFQKKKIKITFCKILKLSLTDIKILKKINNNKYEKYNLSYLKKKSKQKDLFIDIGAHYGFYTINLLSSFEKIYCFEPNKKSFDILKLNLQSTRKVKLYNYLIGKKNQNINFLSSKNSFISQVDGKGVISEELKYFVENIYTTEKKNFLKIYNFFYKKMISNNFYLVYIHVFFYLFKNRYKFSQKKISKIINLLFRYLKFNDRYFCTKQKAISKKIDYIFKKKKYPKTLMKIDVEGFEREVIEGAKKFIINNHPDIFCEIGENQIRIIKMLQKLGYSMLKLDWKSYYFVYKK